MNRILLTFACILAIFSYSLQNKLYYKIFSEFHTSLKISQSTTTFKSSLKFLNLHSQSSSSSSQLAFEEPILWESTKINLDVVQFLLGKDCKFEVFVAFEHPRIWDSTFGLQEYSNSSHDDLQYVIPRVPFGRYNLIAKDKKGISSILMRSVLITSLQKVEISRVNDEEFRAEFISTNAIPYKCFWLYISTFGKGKGIWNHLTTLKTCLKSGLEVAFGKCPETSFFHPTEVKYQFYGEYAKNQLILLYEGCGKAAREGYTEEFPLSTQIVSLVQSKFIISENQHVLIYNHQIDSNPVEFQFSKPFPSPIIYNENLFHSKHWQLEEIWTGGRMSEFEIDLRTYICLKQPIDCEEESKCLQVPIAFVHLEVEVGVLEPGKAFRIQSQPFQHFLVNELQVEIILVGTATKKRRYKSLWKKNYLGIFDIFQIDMVISPEFAITWQKYQIYGPLIVILKVRMPQSIQKWTLLAISKKLFLSSEPLAENLFLYWLYEESAHKRQSTSFLEYNFPGKLSLAP